MKIESPENTYITKSYPPPGNFGQVFIVQRESDQNFFAIKIIHSDIKTRYGVDVKKSFDLFTQGMTHHNSILGIEEYFIYDSSHHFVFEHFNGNTLKMLSEDGIAFNDSITIFESILDGINHSHSGSNALTHNNLHPGNILVDEDLNIKICDIVVSKIFVLPDRHTGKCYLSPEINEGRSRIKNASDVYSLGGIFFQMITGHDPNNNFKHFREELQKKLPSIALALIQQISICILKAMKEYEDERYQSISEFRACFTQAIAAVIIEPVPKLRFIKSNRRT